MRMNPLITSVQNGHIKRIRQLHQKKGRVKAGAFIIEGYHLLEEAIRANWDIQTVVVREKVDVPIHIDESLVIHVSEHVFTHLAQTNRPQGILAVVSIKATEWVQAPLTLLIDAVQDPGNVGTMIRTADAAGFGAVIIGEGSVDIYNDKVIRATQGSLFHVSVIQMNIEEAMEQLRANGIFIIGTALEGAVDYTEMNVHENMALLVGNEGAGVRQRYIKQTNQVVKIPIYGKAESLNVSIAASILMYDMKRKIASFD